MIKEIQNISSEIKEVRNIYGFGSFFNGCNYSDCDLLVIVRDDSSNLGELHRMLSKEFRRIGNDFSIPIDLTVHTESEHEQKTLRDHNKLILL